MNLEDYQEKYCMNLYIAPNRYNRDYEECRCNLTNESCVGSIKDMHEDTLDIKIIERCPKREY